MKINENVIQDDETRKHRQNKKQFLTKANRYPGKVIGVDSEYALTGEALNQDVAKTMLHEGLKTLTGAQDAVEALGFFLDNTDIVGIKVNPQNKLCATHVQLVYELASLIQETGIKSKNIIIWDRFEHFYGLTQAGYMIQKGGDSVQCFATDSSGVGLDPDVYYESPLPYYEGEGYSGTERIYAPLRSNYSRIVTEMTTKIINMPVLKHHGLAGVSLCLKNLGFGSVNNTIRLHVGNCSPSIPEIYNHPVIRNKTVLHIVDGILGWYADSPTYSGPDPLWKFGTLLFGTDPVSIDTIGENLLVQCRRKHDLIEEEDIRVSTHIGVASDVGLGKRENIAYRRISM